MRIGSPSCVASLAVFQFRGADEALQQIVEATASMERCLQEQLRWDVHRQLDVLLEVATRRLKLLEHTCGCSNCHLAVLRLVRLHWNSRVGLTQHTGRRLGQHKTCVFMHSHTTSQPDSHARSAS